MRACEILSFCKSATMFSVDELIFQRNADTNALLSVDELVHVAGGLNSLQFTSGVDSSTTIPVAVGGFAQGTRGCVAVSSCGYQV